MPTSFNSLQDYIFAIKGLLNLILKGLSPSLRHYKYEKRHNTPFRRKLKRLYLSAHILPYQIDYLHFGFATSALQREYIAKSIKAKMSISLRGYDIGVYPFLYPGCFNLLWQMIDKVHITSNDLYVAALKQGMNKDIPHQHISIALDAKSIPSKIYDDASDGVIKILTVGRMHWKKGLEYALQVIKKLIDNNIPVHYTIIGNGPHKDAILFTIQQLNLLDHVTLNGILSNKEVFNIMNQSDIYLQTSVQEGFCCAALEAQASGLLVIATDAEGLNENIENEKSGWIVEKRNVEEIYNRVLQVIDLPVSKKKIITSYARQRVLENFNFDKNINGWKSFFNF